MALVAKHKKSSTASAVAARERVSFESLHSKQLRLAEDRAGRVPSVQKEGRFHGCLMLFLPPGSWDVGQQLLFGQDPEQLGRVP